MIERLQQVLSWIEQLPPEVQEEAAAQLEALTEPFEEILNTKTNKTREKPRSLAGAWHDLAWDDGVEAFDRMRHATTRWAPTGESTILDWVLPWLIESNPASR